MIADIAVGPCTTIVHIFVESESRRSFDMMWLVVFGSVVHHNQHLVSRLSIGYWCRCEGHDQAQCIMMDMMQRSRGVNAYPPT